MASERNHWPVAQLIADYRYFMGLYWHCDWDNNRAHSYYQKAKASYDKLMERWGVEGDLDEHVMAHIEGGHSDGRTARSRFRSNNEKAGARHKLHPR